MFRRSLRHSQGKLLMTVNSFVKAHVLYFMLCNSTNVTGKDKAVPLQAWSGPEGSRKFRFLDFMTTAQYGGKVSLTHRPPLPPGNTPGIHFC
jgi:hypothetical protein